MFIVTLSTLEAAMTPGISNLSVSSPGNKLLVQAMTPECLCCQFEFTSRNCWYRLRRLNVHVVRSSGEKLLVQAVMPGCSCCQVEFTRRETAGPGYDVWMFMSDWVHQKLLVQAMTPGCSCCQIKFIKRNCYGTWMFMLSDQVYQKRNCWCRLWHLNVLLLLCVCVCVNKNAMLDKECYCISFSVAEIV